MVKKVLFQWSKETLGNIFQEIITLEEVIKVNETQFELDPSGTNRENLHKSQAELRKQLQREEEFWKQKAGMEWFKEGEKNTKFFHTIEDSEDFELLKELPVVINDEMNEELQSMLTTEEVKRAVMSLNKDSVVGPDGIISPEQAGFVQGRSISENVSLVQEIITEIRKRGKSPNLVIKLDMMKAYDKMEWLFMTKIDQFQLVPILLNGQPKRFFKSSRGLKQGDPLSPTLFILAAEVMSRSLNSLIKKKEFKRFGMPRGSQ
ncbi:uncharacterized protein [Solanum tuberosum]|uniref:uncharacterized protein n=1 Tax=Solanum tuberosum TaxID=4113 RepID=UPI00073A11D4|nr:PREDICTED: uncharacterized protein LOC107059850 [Solanum tuberosum]